jgi:hypothetical protein
MAKSDVRLDGDLAFHSWSWRVERIAWLGMLLILAAALFGLFGGGLLSHRQLRTADGSMVLEYDRFGQVSADTILNLSLQFQGLPGPRNVWINRSYLDHFDIRQVTPNPGAMELSRDGWLYTFASSQAGESFPIRVILTPRHTGRFSGCVNSVGRALCFQQFVYP